jgi:hypothetical protein
MQTDPLIPAAAREAITREAFNQLLDKHVPRSIRPDDWFELNEAVDQLIVASQELAVRQHGQVVRTALSGDLWDQLAETCQEWER